MLALVNGPATRLLAWVQHRDHTWAKVARDHLQPAPATGTITTPPLAAGRYRVEWWDTRGGTVSSADTVVHAGGTLAVRTPAIAADAALKVIALPD